MFSLMLFFINSVKLKLLTNKMEILAKLRNSTVSSILKNLNIFSSVLAPKLKNIFNFAMSFVEFTFKSFFFALLYCIKFILNAASKVYKVIIISNHAISRFFPCFY